MTHDLTKCDGNRCVGFREWCAASSPGKTNLCTLRKGHSGPHIQCGGRHHNLASWPNESAPEPICPTCDPMSRPIPALPIDTIVTKEGEIVHLPSLELRAKIAAMVFTMPDFAGGVELAVKTADQIIAECRRTQGGGK